ncbi:MAG: low molecular weight protein-tyrosine-phosphatase [Candidatus Sericytochromatia bacterium]|nr:low molecular weight protein-tyrosine-phosphatase [Candidatus Sericytochromatia bacterium]
MSDVIEVLFVCMGNICRSPTAHGVMRHLVATRGLAHRVRVDSAATHDYHPGEPPDRRTVAHARRRGYDLSDLRARQVGRDDFARAHHVLVMDAANERAVAALCPPEHLPKVRRLTAHLRRLDHDHVPDPYYGGPEGFEVVLDLCEDACAGLLEALVAEGRAAEA